MSSIPQEDRDNALKGTGNVGVSFMLENVARDLFGGRQ